MIGQLNVSTLCISFLLRKPTKNRFSNNFRKHQNETLARSGSTDFITALDINAASLLFSVQLYLLERTYQQKQQSTIFLHQIRNNSEHINFIVFDTSRFTQSIKTKNDIKARSLLCFNHILNEHVFVLN